MNCASYLGDISTEDFLSQYWQKKPLVIKNAFPNIKPLVSAEELAGLACEEHVNSRLVIANDSKSKQSWQVEFGPFDETRFSELPETNWTLLVSDIERHLPETKSLLKHFRFIPDWRIDDLMISYAPTGGSVGAHTDAYDVFLLQVSGQRLWKISECFSDEVVNDSELSILKNFHSEQEYLLNAGDMLYLPPNIAHHGIAQQLLDDKGNETQCLTASVGFRAPSLKTITSDYIHFINEQNKEQVRYSDNAATKPFHHAEISDETVDHFINYLKQGLSIDREQVRQWLGQYCSDNRAFEELERDELNINFDTFSQIASESTLAQSPYSNFLFSHTDDASTLFIDGSSYQTSKEFSEILCQEQQIDFKKLKSIMTATDKDVLLTLFCLGSIVRD